MIKKHFENFSLLVIVAGFLTLSLSTLSKASIWFDEAFSAYIIRFNFGEIWHYTSVDVHPPMYYFVLKLWSGVFGTSDFALRSLSVFFGVITLLVAYFFTRRVFGKKIALAAAGFLAISPMLIRYSQEARMYTMVAFLGVMAVWAFYETWIAKNSLKLQKRWRIMYILAVLFGIYTQYLSALIPLSLWIFRAIVVWKSQQKKCSFLSFLRFRKPVGLREKIREFFGENWLISHIVIGLAYLPWIPIFFAQAAYVKEKFWIPALDFSTIPNMISNFFLFLNANETNGWLSIALFFILVVLAIFVFEKFKKADFEKSFWLVFAVSIMPITILYLASLPPLSSIFVDRYLLMAEVFISIFLALAFFEILKKKKIVAILLVMMIVFSHIFGVFQVNLKHGVSKNDGKITEIRQAVEMIRREDKNAQIAVIGFLYYSAAQYSNNESKIWFYGEPPIYHSGDMIRADYTPKIEKGFTGEELFVVEELVKNDENVKTKKVEIEGYELVKEEVYQDSINHKPLYGIFKFIKK